MGGFGPERSFILVNLLVERGKILGKFAARGIHASHLSCQKLMLLLSLTLHGFCFDNVDLGRGCFPWALIIVGVGVWPNIKMRSTMFCSNNVPLKLIFSVRNLHLDNSAMFLFLIFALEGETELFATSVAYCLCLDLAKESQ